MSPSRRQAIATIAGVLAGGSAISAISSSKTSNLSALAQSSSTETIELANLPKEITLTLDAGDFKAYRLVVEEQTTIGISGLVRWGAEMDLLTFASAAEYRAYVNTYRAQYIPELSAFGQLEFEGLSGSVGSDDNSEYYITIDNTDWQGEFPNVVSNRQANENEGLTKNDTANDPDERSNATGDPSLGNERGGVTVMGNGQNRARISLTIFEDSAEE